jgi:hypothetical protein
MARKASRSAAPETANPTGIARCNVRADEFQRRASEPPPGLVREMWSMIMQNKKWWLVPILLMLLVLGTIVFLGGTAAAPFIYTLF